MSSLCRFRSGSKRPLVWEMQNLQAFCVKDATCASILCERCNLCQRLQSAARDRTCNVRTAAQTWTRWHRPLRDTARLCTHAFPHVSMYRMQAHASSGVQLRRCVSLLSRRASTKIDTQPRGYPTTSGHRRVLACARGSGLGFFAKERGML